jgi:hypothetical protein
MKNYVLYRGRDLTVQYQKTQSFCHILSFSVSTIFAGHTSKLYSISRCVLTHNFVHFCSCLCYAMLRISKICNFLVIDDILYKPQRKKSTGIRFGDLGGHARKLPLSHPVVRKTFV